MLKKSISRSTKKKLFIILGCVLLIVIILLAIPRSTYQKWFGKADVIDQPSVDQRPHQIVYVINQNQQLVGLKLKVNEISEDQVIQKWNLLTSEVSTYPVGYYSPIDTSSKLSDYQINEGILTLNVSSEFSNSDGKEAIASLAWTFCNDDISEVIIKINDEVIKKVSDYEFRKIDRSITVNYVYETSFLFESDYTTVIYHEDNYILPVTYFYKDLKEEEFIVSKILDENLIINNAYSYEVSEDGFTLNLAYDEVLDDETLKEISETVKYNLAVNSLIINNNVMTIYQESFIENSETPSVE